MTLEQLQTRALEELANGRRRLSPGLKTELAEAGSKFCYTCQGVKPLEEFVTYPKSKDGKRSYCLECKRAAHNKHYAENREEYQRRYREKFPPKSPEYDRSVYRQRCYKCKETKTYLEFHLDSSKRSGLNDMCTECRKRRSRENPLIDRNKYGKRRAKQLGAPWEDFTAEDIIDYWKSFGIDPLKSAYSGVPLTPDNYSMDHVIPLSHENIPGHVLANLAPCTWEENRTKHHHPRIPFMFAARRAATLLGSGDAGDTTNGDSDFEL